MPDMACPGTPSACLQSVFGTWNNDGTGIFAPPPADGGLPADWAVVAGFGNPVLCGATPEMNINADLAGNPRSTTKGTTIGAVVTSSNSCPQ